MQITSPSSFKLMDAIVSDSLQGFTLHNIFSSHVACVWHNSLQIANGISAEEMVNV